MIEWKYKIWDGEWSVETGDCYQYDPTQTTGDMARNIADEEFFLNGHEKFDQNDGTMIVKIWKDDESKAEVFKTWYSIKFRARKVKKGTF